MVRWSFFTCSHARLAEFIWQFSSLRKAPCAGRAGGRIAVAGLGRFCMCACSAEQRTAVGLLSGADVIGRAQRASMPSTLRP
jgi:hypothetical protein